MKVAIAGYGLEGEQNYIYWRTLGHDVTIHDEKEVPDRPLPSGATTILGPETYDDLADYDLVIRTAGLPPRKLESAKHVWSATNEFFDKCPAPIIGVTGTKGKGTTASLIANILREAGKSVHLVGNIGVPALEVLASIKAEDIVVFELSSFQLWDIKKSPQVAVVLMIETDHLDVHKDFDDYISAKANIRRFQGLDDICIYHPTNEYARRIALAGTNELSEHERHDREAQAFRYAIADDRQVYLKENTFFAQDHAICGVDTLQVVGAHNSENACAAISAARVFTLDDEAVKRGMQSFTGLDHRLKFVREHRGVRYYDDSIATTPGSAIAAIEAFSEPKLLILGGKHKGADYHELIERCADTDTHVLAIGSNGNDIVSLCQERGVAVTDATQKNMQEVVREAEHIVKPGWVVILSPAAASFDMFKSYADRGDQFVAAVEALA
jgi:UDP-N-acetylmuramoylalanine--D-glutamate ligase